MIKRFCNAGREWLPLPSYLGGDSWHKIDMEISNYQGLEDVLTSSEQIISNGLRWNVQILPNADKIGVFLQARMVEDDDSLWRCKGEIKVKIFSAASTHADLDVKNDSCPCPSDFLTWTRGNRTIGFPAIINRRHERFRELYSLNGTVKISVQFLLQKPTGFYTDFQRRMKNMLESAVDSDIDLVSRQDEIKDQMLMPCHSHVLKSLAGSPVFKEVIKNLEKEQDERIEIELNLRPDAVRCLLEFIYYEKDSEIIQNPQMAYDLFTFALEYKMAKLVDRCIQAFSSQEFQNNAADFEIDIALDLYLMGAIYMGRMINKVDDGMNKLMPEQRCSLLTKSMIEIMKRKNLEVKKNADAFESFSQAHLPLSQVLKMELKNDYGENTDFIPLWNFKPSYVTSYFRSYSETSNKTTLCAKMSYWGRSKWLIFCDRSLTFYATYDGQYEVKAFSKLESILQN